MITDPDRRVPISSIASIDTVTERHHATTLATPESGSIRVGTPDLLDS